MSLTGQTFANRFGSEWAVKLAKNSTTTTTEETNEDVPRSYKDNEHEQIETAEQLHRPVMSVYGYVSRRRRFYPVTTYRYRYRFAEICEFRPVGNLFSRRYPQISGRFMRVPGPSVCYRVRSIEYPLPLSPIFGLTIALSRGRTRL